MHIISDLSSAWTQGMEFVVSSLVVRCVCTYVLHDNCLFALQFLGLASSCVVCLRVADYASGVARPK